MHNQKQSFKNKTSCVAKREESHTLSAFLTTDDLSGFIQFLFHENLNNFVPQLYEKLNAKRFASLLHSLYEVLSESNFESFEAKCSDLLWDNYPQFYEQVREIYIDM